MPQTVISTEHSIRVNRIISALFLVLGMVFSTWASRIPHIRDIIELTATTFMWTLLARGLSQVLFFPISAFMVEILGGKKASFLSGLVLVGTLPFYPIMPDWISLLVLFILVGGFSGAFDISINALGAEAEKNQNKPLMSRLHAWFCVGNFGGALLGTVSIYLNISTILHFSIVSMGLLAILTYSQTVLLSVDSGAPKKTMKFVLPHGGLLWLGVIAFLGAVVEGSINNWVTLFYSDVILTSESLAPVGYVAYSGAMLIGRLYADRIKQRFGGRKTMFLSVTLASIGLTLSVVFPEIWIATIGFALAGIGFSVVFPFVFSAAGREGSLAISSVATMGYLGGIVAPLLIGLIVEKAGLQLGFVVLVVAGYLMLVASLKAKLLTKT